MTAQTPAVDRQLAPASLGGAVGRWLRPIREASGVPRAVLAIGAAITLFFIVLAVAAPLIAPYGFDAYRTDEGVRFVKQEAPSAAHLFGTTVQSTDVLSRVIFGASTALQVVALAVAFSILIGVPLGLVSGYYGGLIDRLLVLVTDAIFAFPYLLLAIVISFLLADTLGRGVGTAAIAISVIYVPQYFRVVRNHVISVREEPFVEAARALGASSFTTITRYVFPSVVQSVPVIATLNAADAILTLAGLGFLGYGIPPSQAAEWGYDLQRAISDAGAGIWWTGLFPGLAIVGLVTGLTLLGEGLNDVLNPLLRSRVIRPELPQRDAPASASRPAPLSRTETAPRVISVRDLRVAYGTAGGTLHAVDGVSFDIHRGETLGLVGESGCGKSTMGKALLGLLPPSAGMTGEIRYADENITSLMPSELRHLRGPEIGLIFQEPMTRLNPLMRISDHFREVLQTHEPGISDAEVTKRSLEALGGVGIPPTRFRQYPHEFSGGMRQRIMIALTLVLRPKLVIADEPTTALDVIVEAQILGILADLKRNFDTSLLLITHNLGIVAEACDRVAVMYAGEIVEQGDAREVFQHPNHPYTQELLRSVISLRTEGLQYIPGSPPDLVSPPSGCRFHPRCPHAMEVCAAKVPVPQQANGSLVRCWLHGPEEQIPAGGRRPLERAEISTADEA